KVGSAPEHDPARMAVAKAAIGNARLFIDANGAFTPKRAVALAHEAHRYDVAWFEEPVSSDDPAGMASVRASTPAGIEVAAGEYIYTLNDLRGL
ncbi:enolase C-terminal domain-like protein, partial [Mycobacterium kansasii]